MFRPGGCRLRAQGRDHLAPRYGLGRPERRGDGLRLTAREAEEARKNVALVLGGEDLRNLDDAREAETTVAQRRLDVGVLLDELGGGLPVLRGAGGQRQLAAEVREERGVGQLAPQLLPVEVRERDEELRHRGVLAAEKFDEAAREFVSVRHEPIVSRDFRAPRNARGRSRARERLAGSRTPPRPQDRLPHRAQRPSRGILRGVATARPLRAQWCQLANWVHQSRTGYIDRAPALP
jgi:hypothetical protein